jgi:hypothetical protein
MHSCGVSPFIAGLDKIIKRISIAGCSREESGLRSPVNLLQAPDRISASFQATTISVGTQ